ncbi:MAG: PilC/PilY family type IV pilus protein [candidate division WOR-3 bacterium]
MKKMWIFIIMGVYLGAERPPCLFPPFLGVTGAVVAPHVALVLDYSGSMLFNAFPDEYQNNYNNNYNFYGSFDKGYYYKYNSTGGYWEKDIPYTPGSPPFDEATSRFSGNFLNWAQWMNRMNIIKKVLTGEYIDQIDGNYGIANLRKRSNIYGTEVYQRYYYLSGTRRILIYFNNDGFSEANNCKVGGTFYVNIEKYQRNPRTGRWEWVTEKTVIPQSPWKIRDEIQRLRGVIEKFSDEDMDGLVDEGKPWWSVIKFNQSNSRVLDQKQNVISTLETHIQGEQANGNTPTKYAMQQLKDLYDDTGVSGNHNPNTDIFFDEYCDEPQGIWCKRAYAILMSDGAWNTGGDPLSLAHQIHYQDLRGDLQGVQNVTLFTIFTFASAGDNGEESLKWMALFGGFEDKDLNNYPGHYTTYPSPNSLAQFYLPTPYDQLDIDEWDNDQNGLPDNYYNAETGEAIEEALKEIFQKIKQEVAAATGAPTFPVTARGEGLSFQAFFSPMRKNELNKEIYWIGYLNTLWVDKEGNLREDSDQNLFLNYFNDYIVRFKFNSTLGQTFVIRYRDNEGDGKFNGADTIPIDSALIYNIRATVKHAELLKNRSEDQRRIKYVSKTGASYILKDFTNSNINELRTLLDVATNSKADTIINYIRGKDYPNLRSRYLNGNVWKLGDIVNSTPVYVSTPQERYDIIYGDISYLPFYTKYLNKRGILITGANDGILHIFNNGVFEEIKTGNDKGKLVNKLPYGIGEEIAGIIPRNLLPHLKYFSEPEYEGCHLYFVDGRPYVTDVQVFDPDNIHPNGWGTILIQGMNFGGYPALIGSEILKSSFLILDITDPSDISNIKVLTEFQDINLGYTTSFPGIVKIDTTWYLGIGSGPTVIPEGFSDQNAHLFIINLKNPSTVYRFDLGSRFNRDSSFLNDLAPADINLDFTVDHLFFAINKHKPNDEWVTDIIMVETNNERNPSDWNFYRVFTIPAPVTAELSPVVDEFGNIWILFGTGKFWDLTDFNLEHSEYLVGFKVDRGITKTLSYLVDVTDAAVISTPGGDSVISSLGRYTFDQFENLIKSSGGWFIKLEDDERCISRPAVVGGAAIFTTLNPLLSGTEEICNPCQSGQVGGAGRIWGIYLKTGTAYITPILGVVTQLPGGKERIEREKQVAGLPSEPTLHIGEEGGTIFVQTTTGVIEKYDINLPLAPKKGTILWKKER